MAQRFWSLWLALCPSTHLDLHHAYAHLVAAVEIIGEQAQRRLPGRQQRRHSAEHALSRHFSRRCDRHLAAACSHGEQQQEALHSDVLPPQALKWVHNKGVQRMAAAGGVPPAAARDIAGGVDMRRLSVKMQRELQTARMAVNIATSEFGNQTLAHVAPVRSFRGTPVWLSRHPNLARSA